MGLNIAIYKGEKELPYVEFPDKRGWDFIRYGGDRDFVSALWVEDDFTAPSKFNEEGIRITEKGIKFLREWIQQNECYKERLNFLLDLMEDDEEINLEIH